MERLSSVARAVASDWPSSRKPSEEPTPAQVLAALAHEEAAGGYPAFSRRGWTPAADDTATVVLSYAHGDSVPAVTLHGAIDTTRFQRMALAAVRAARATAGRRIPQRDTLPLQLREQSSGAPAVIRLHFGSEPGPTDGVARFAVVEREVAPFASTQRLLYPESERAVGREGQVMLTVGIRPDGTPDLSTLRVISATSADFRKAVLQHFSMFRYRPAERDCRPVYQLVQQPFVFRLNRRPILRR